LNKAISTDQDTILPNYSGRGITNIPASVLRHFDIEISTPPLDESVINAYYWEQADVIVTLLIDALGYHQLERAIANSSAPGISSMIRDGRAVLNQLTSTFPSTTVTALTTLGFALAPSAHGIISQRFFEHRLGTIIDLLYFTASPTNSSLELAGVQPEDLIEYPTVFELLTQHGINAILLNHWQFMKSPLSRMNNRGAYYVPYFSISDFFYNLVEAINSINDKGTVQAYWPGVDTISHFYGTSSKQHDFEIELLDWALTNILLPQITRKKVLLIITADHGQCDVDFNSWRWLNDYPDLTNMLAAPPAGLDRAVLLYSRPNREVELQAFLEEHFGQDTFILNTREVLELGLYGSMPENASIVDRMGTYLLIPKGKRVLRYEHDPNNRNPNHKGKHGGLTPQEMLVPFIQIRIN